MNAALPRRAILVALAASSAAAVPACAAASAAEAHPDAALIALGPALRGALAEADRFEAAHARITDAARRAVIEEIGPEPQTNKWTPEWGAWDDRYQAVRSANGGHDTWKRWSDAEDVVEAVAEPLLALRAVTVDGLHLKALMASRDERFAESIVADLLAMRGEA